MTFPRLTVNPWRFGLLVAIGLFLLTRLLTLNTFPIFNDEAIYLRYAQKIHEDWQTNRFVSMHGEFTDWKPPLQYWMAAPVIEWGNDPLLAGRAVALLASVAGLFGSYLFAKELFTEREGVIAALLFVLCPPVLFHNVQFTAETFLFSTAPLFYWALLKAMRRERANWGWAFGAAGLGTILLLLKQSGFLLLSVSALLPFARLRRKEVIPGGTANRASEMPSVNQWNWREFARNNAIALTVIASSLIAANGFLPAEFAATRERFNSRWVISLHELSDLPTGLWQANLRVVADYIGSSYSWVAFLLFSVFIWLAARRKNCAELTLLFMCLAGAGGILILLRGFNEYLFNTAVIAALLPLFARTGIIVHEFRRKGKAGLVRAAVLLCAGATLVNWGCQDILMSISPGRYIERNSRWAKANYLTSWSTGFGVSQIVAMLEKEKASGIVFTDPQWGNPGTALEVYQAKRFPNLRIVPISREFLDPSESRKLTNVTRKIAPARYAIFSADGSGRRREWLENVEREMCETRTEIRAYPSQMPVNVCRF